MKLYSDYEIDLLIDEITEAALEAIEKAAGEAAKAATLAAVEREAEHLQANALAYREAAYMQAEAQRWRLQAEAYSQEVKLIRKAGTKNTIIAALVGVLGGLTVSIFIR